MWEIDPSPPRLPESFHTHPRTHVTGFYDEMETEMRCPNPAGHPLSMQSVTEWPLSIPRGDEHRATDRGRTRPHFRGAKETVAAVAGTKYRCRSALGQTPHIGGIGRALAVAFLKPHAAERTLPVPQVGVHGVQIAALVESTAALRDHFQHHARSMAPSSSSFWLGAGGAGTGSGVGA